MTDTPPTNLNADALPEDAPFIAGTTCWLERAVIGLNLCPFARAPHVQAAHAGKPCARHRCAAG